MVKSRVDVGKQLFDSLKGVGLVENNFEALACWLYQQTLWYSPMLDCLQDVVAVPLLRRF